MSRIREISDFKGIWFKPGLAPSYSGRLTSSNNPGSGFEAEL